MGDFSFRHLQVDGHMGYVASLISRKLAKTDVLRDFVNGFDFDCISPSPSAG